MALRNYTNTATEATLTAGIGASDTSWDLTSFAGYPTPPFTASIERGTANEEIVLVTGVSAATVSCQRGYNGTTAKTHAAGSSFLHVVVALDYTEANAHVNATSGAHGVAGNFVGTTDVQTLTNKTLISPVLSAPTFSGTATFSAASLTGTLNVAGQTTLAGLTVGGSATVAGTFTVTGATTLAALTVASLDVSSTLSVAGVLSANGGITVPSGKRVTLTDAPVDGTDAANKLYVDGVVGNSTAASSTATANSLVKRDASARTQFASPSAAADAATKGYVDGLIAGLRTFYVQSAAPTGTIADGSVWFQTP